MKRILTILAVVLCLCIMSTVAYANEGNVEISFRVGENVLKINGVDTSVETPYVVGDGVTLVPVRVITEAFGAKVGWIEETETVTLEYPDVNIVLQIGNSIAEVNGKAVTLLAPPELAGAGYTMVPLRFISENFGAEVSYDAATEAIKVVKQAADNSSSTVIGSIDNDYIGDSYYKWTMENPKDMTMEERSFDGLYTCFSYGEENMIHITYSLIDEDYDFEKEFSNNKSSLSDYTLVKADKKTDGPVKTAHFQAKDKDEFLNIQYYVTENSITEIFGSFDNSDTAKRDEFIRIMSTFKTEFDSKAYDLSNAVDGWRNFEDEFTGLSLMIPENYYQLESDSQNEFEFMSTDTDDTLSRINADMYSKSEVGSALQLAKKDLENNKNFTNKNIVNHSDIITMIYNGTEVYEYTETVSGSLGFDHERKDVFFEKGDYVYNISICVKMPSDRKEAIFSKVLFNIKVNDINPDDVGIVMRNERDDDHVYKSKADDWTLELPNSFSEITVTNTSSVYIDSQTGTMLTVLATDADRTTTNVLEFMKTYLSETLKKKHTYTEKSVSQDKTGMRNFVTATIRFDDDTRAYTKYYALFDSRKLFLIAATIPELSYSDDTLKRLDNIAKTITVTN